MYSEDVTIGKQADSKEPIWMCSNRGQSHLSCHCRMPPLQCPILKLPFSALATSKCHEELCKREGQCEQVF